MARKKSKPAKTIYLIQSTADPELIWLEVENVPPPGKVLATVGPFRSKTELAEMHAMLRKRLKPYSRDARAALAYRVPRWILAQLCGRLAA